MLYSAFLSFPRNAYQPQPVTQAQRRFKWIPPPDAKFGMQEDSSVPEWRAVRVRRGRGGVLRVDRHTTCRSLARDELLGLPCRLTSSANEKSEEESTTDTEVSWRIRDRWLFDADGEPSVGPDGPDEKDRAVDEFHPKYVLPFFKTRIVVDCFI
jgi:enhancer of polycomb-like protein